VSRTFAEWLESQEAAALERLEKETTPEAVAVEVVRALYAIATAVERLKEE
jgi:hypothetical protein